MDDQTELVAKILGLRKSLLDDRPNIRCVVISVLEEGSDSPIVIYHGDQIEYTALSIEVARVLRQRVLEKINGTQQKQGQG